MKEQKRKRILALLVSICMVFSLVNTGVYVETVTADEVEEGSGDESISSFGITVVTGSAITYYVGGTGADDANAGTDSSAPLATLVEAAARTKDPDRQVVYDEIGRESYIIIVQDDITVAGEVSFGDGSVSINTMIMGSVTGSAIVLRDPGYTGNIIKVPYNTTLKIGNMFATDDDDLIFDGNSGEVTAQAPIIKNEGDLFLFNGVTLQNNNNNSDYNGGAITTSRSLRMYGGTLQNNSSIHGGGMYNSGSIDISGGYIINNRASSNGGGIYTTSGLTLNGGTISNNEGANGGGVYNSGSFSHILGNIGYNTANNGGGVYNSCNFDLIGGIITGNVALLGSGVYNSSRMVLYSGEIIDNGLNEVNYRGGGIYNPSFATLTVYGGKIADNKANEGGGINNSLGTMNILAGNGPFDDVVEITGNNATIGSGIYTTSGNTLAGDFIMSADDDIFMESCYDSINIAATISNTGTFTLGCSEFLNGRQLLVGSASVIAAASSLFTLSDPDYMLNSMGIVYYTGESVTYYVGGSDASDDNTGITATQPYETLEKAVETIGSRKATIILQSDIELLNELEIYGDITIVSDGNVRTITRALDLNGSMIFINHFGILTLGDSNGAVEADTLIFDGNFEEDYIVDNYYGTFNLCNGAMLTNNRESAVYNNNIFNMSGGTITGNDSSYGGGVYNNNNFYMTGGTISNNSAGYGGGISNDGTFVLTGGTISNNSAQEEGGGIGNYGYFTMGGNALISGNEAYKGGAVMNYYDFTMTGGTISGNTAQMGGAVRTESIFHISGTASIPGVLTEYGYYSNDVFLATGVSTVIIEDDWSGSEMIALSLDKYYDGREVLSGNALTVASHYSKFLLADQIQEFTITNDGILNYLGVGFTFYVDGVDGSDIIGTGDVHSPYATLEKAVEEIEINSEKGTIYIMSDIELMHPIVITKSITILSHDDPDTGTQESYRITRNDSFSEVDVEYSSGYYESTGVMIYVSGSLILGDRENAGDDENPSLVFDGRRSEGVEATFEIVKNRGSFYLYKGVSLEENHVIPYYYYSAGGVRNEGLFRMYGGSICNNFGYVGGVDNYGDFLMAGGAISGNYGETGGIINHNLLTMDGGSILGNEGTYESSGVLNYGNFILKDGKISNNIGGFFGAVATIISYENGLMVMEGGRITNNTSTVCAILNCGDFIMKGGSIANNSSIFFGGVNNEWGASFIMMGGDITSNSGGDTGGVMNAEEAEFHMSGGMISSNESAVGYGEGVVNMPNAIFSMAGDAIITSDNDIALIQGSSLMSNVITLKGALTGTYPSWDTLGAARITPLYDSMGYVDNLYPGVQVLAAGEDYSITEEDLEYFTLGTDTSFCITIEGDIAVKIPERAGEITYGDIYYDGTCKLVDSITVIVDSNILTEGVDYEVSYENNINAGTQAKVIITGIGIFTGTQEAYFTILPAPVVSIATLSPEPLTFMASDGMNEAELLARIGLSQVALNIAGGTVSSPMTWSKTSGTYKVKGGSYTYTGTIDGNPNLVASDLSLTTTITVLPSIPVNPVYGATMVTRGSDTAATAAELGENILPTSGTMHWEEYETPLTYTVEWDDQTLDTTNLLDSVTFTGEITYTNIPAWATEPGNLTVTRTVGVTDKAAVVISGVSISNKVYNGLPISFSGTPANAQGYTGAYEYQYTSTDDKGYDSSIAPKDAGSYLLTISIPENNSAYAGSKELAFTISKKAVIIKAEDKVVRVGDLLPEYTYEFIESYGLVGEETLTIQPQLNANGATTSAVGGYTITASGASAGNNYSITYQFGTLTVEEIPSYIITVIYGAHGRISPIGAITVEENESITFTILPDSNYTILEVMIDGISIGSATNYTFEHVIADHTIQASFQVVTNGVTPPPVTPNVTPTPTPTPTPAPIIETVALGNQEGSVQISISQNMTQGNLEADLTLPEDQLLGLAEANTSGEPIKLTVPVTSQKLLELIAEDTTEKININLNIPDSLLAGDDFTLADINLDPELLEAARAAGKDITITIKDENGKERYSWTFTGSILTATDNVMTDVNLSLEIGDAIENSELRDLLHITDTVDKDSDDMENSESDDGGIDGSGSTMDNSAHGLMVTFNHEGDLPVQSSVRIYVGDKEGLHPGDKVYLYYYNPENGKLETLPYSSGYEVDEEGYITIELLHCSDYVLLPEEADPKVVASLRDQISITPASQTLYLDETEAAKASIKINLPKTLQLVNSFEEETSSSAVGAVKVSFRSSNKNVVTVDKNGELTATGKGTAYIYTKVTLYSGKTKTFVTKITVK